MGPLSCNVVPRWNLQPFKCNFVLTTTITILSSVNEKNVFKTWRWFFCLLNWAVYCLNGAAEKVLVREKQTTQHETAQQPAYFPAVCVLQDVGSFHYPITGVSTVTSVGSSWPRRRRPLARTHRRSCASAHTGWLFPRSAVHRSVSGASACSKRCGVDYPPPQ